MTLRLARKIAGLANHPRRAESDRRLERYNRNGPIKPDGYRKILQACNGRPRRNAPDGALAFKPNNGGTFIHKGGGLWLPVPSDYPPGVFDYA